MQYSRYVQYFRESYTASTNRVDEASYGSLSRKVYWNGIWGSHLVTLHTVITLHSSVPMMEATGSLDTYAHFYHTRYYMLQIATFTVISLQSEHRNSWIGRSANHAHTYQRVFMLLQQCTWQLYHTESLNLMEHPMAAVVLRTAIQETHRVTYIFTIHYYIHDHYSTYTGGGWCHSYHISSAMDIMRALMTTTRNSTFQCNSSYIL